MWFYVLHSVLCRNGFSTVLHTATVEINTAFIYNYDDDKPRILNWNRLSLISWTNQVKLFYFYILILLFFYLKIDTIDYCWDNKENKTEDILFLKL